jgi:hypothetical protein
MNIAYTVTPLQQPTFEEWYEEFNIGALTPKLDNRAADLSSQYDFRNRESMSILDRILSVGNY